MEELTGNFAGEISQSWSAEEAIAYECARECISHMIAIQSHRLAEEKARLEPDVALISTLRQEQARLAEERACLKIQDQAAISQTRQVYGAAIRNWNEQRAKQMKNGHA